MTIARTILLLIAVQLTVGTALLLVLAFMLFEAEQQTQMETHANEVKSAIEKIGILARFSFRV